MSLLDALALPQAAQYRARAAQLEAEARIAADPDLAAGIRLAEDAERHESALS